MIDPASMTEAAQKAIDAGDYLHAERLLREAAVVQEASLGALHPDLASTLNNLGLVYEHTNKIVEAEHSYRRAHAIAVASLRPGHPFIATSLKNLVDFCEARHIPIWRPPITPVPDELVVFDTEVAASPQAPARPSPIDDAATIDVMRTPYDTAPEIRQASAVWSPGAFRMIGLASLAGVAIVVGSLAMRPPGTSSANGIPEPSSTTEPSPVAAPPAPVASSAPVLEAPPTRPEPAEARRGATDNTPEASAISSERLERRETSVAPAVTVLKAQLCTGIRKQGSPDWQCAEAGGDLQPGTYSFYTRLSSKTETTVEHRWYRGDRVHQVMRLRIAANPTSGYRTFSSTTISPERAGTWKVELRAADGALLQEERFVVH